mgnify:CR=1 FL=1
MDNAGLSRIGQIAINVHNVKTATAFYREKLGMKFLFEVPNMSFFDCGGVRLMLGSAEKPEFDHPASIIYYAVADIHKTHEMMTFRGVQFESNPHVVARMPAMNCGWHFFVIWTTICWR